MDLFQTYEREFQDACESARERIKVIPSLQGQTKRTAITTAQSHIDDAEETLQTYELGLRGVSDVRRRSDLENQVSKFYGVLSTLKQDLKVAEVKLSTDRAALFAGASSAIDTSSLSQRERLEGTTKQMQQDVDSLKDALITTHRTIDTGTQVMIDLDEQGERLGRTRGRLEGITSTLDSARRLTNEMGRRLMSNKFIIAIIVLILLVAIGVIIYLKWGR